MIHNPVIDTLMARKSVRKFTDQVPTEEEIETIVRAGQQAPFAMQLGDMVLDRGPKNMLGAPLLFIICYDIHRMGLVAKQRNWDIEVDDMQLMFFGVQDAAYMAQNMVIAAESLGMGSCYLGMTPFIAPSIKKKYNLPDRVFPVVSLAIGFPDEWEDQFPPRPRYPMNFSCFDGEYPELSDETVAEAMLVMDQGYLAQGYYEKQGAMINLHGKKEETFTFEDYSWTEHISRKVALYTDAHLLTAYQKIGFQVPEE